MLEFYSRALGVLAGGCVLAIAIAAPSMAQSPPQQPAARVAAPDGAEAPAYLNEDFTDRATAATPANSAYRPLTGYGPRTTTASVEPARPTTAAEHELVRR